MINICIMANEQNTNIFFSSKTQTVKCTVAHDCYVVPESPPFILSLSFLQALIDIDSINSNIILRRRQY